MGNISDIRQKVHFSTDDDKIKEAGEEYAAANTSGLRFQNIGLADDCFTEFDLRSPREGRLTTTENALAGRDSAFGPSDRQLREVAEIDSDACPRAVASAD